MKCKKCRKEIPDGSKFCNHCGSNQDEIKKVKKRYQKKITVNGKRITFNAKSKKELNQKILAYNSEQEEKSKGIEFKIVADEWKTITFETLSPNSKNSYTAKYKRITEYFNNMRITEIEYADVNRFVQQFPKTWAFKTFAGYLNVLKLIFDYAIRMNYVKQNPCNLVQIPRNLKKEHRRSITEYEMEVIKSRIDVEGGLLAFFILYTGLRRGEVVALQWKDIDFKNKIITVDKSVCWESNSPLIKRPKTEAGIREVILLDDLEKVLLPIKKKGNDIIFSDNGKYYPNSKLTRLWDRWKKASGLTDVTPHMIRHGYSTMLFNAGVPVKAVQHLMGPQYSTTMDIYTDVTKKYKDETRQKINKYLDTVLKVSS